MISRRSVLRGLGGIAMAPTFFQTVSATEADSGTPGTILVCIMLAGGNDGLNTVVPLAQYGAYVKLRTPTTPPPGLALAYTRKALQPLAFDANPLTAAASSTAYAFAPGMQAMRDLYAGGNLAVITGVGLPAAETNPLSHLNGQMDWLTGQINVGSTPPSGWLGLTLDGQSAGTLGPTASMGGASPLLTGTTAQGLVINPPMDYFGVNYGTSDNYYGMLSAYKQIGVLPPANPAAAYDQQQMLTALNAIHAIQKDAAASPAPNYATPTWLDYQLRDIARLINAGAGIRGYYAVQGGYDSHSAQMQTQPLLVSQLGASLSQFLAYLRTQGVSQNVVVMTMSDFGRRPAANLDFGTDHGGATVSFVLGDQVKGGVYGNYPSLSRFDGNGNLKLNVDFRNVLSDLIGKMNANPATILGQAWPSLGFI
jgi:uncharacterized protein (DUF1501 family)